VQGHHGNGSALPMLVQSGNLSLEIWSCRRALMVTEQEKPPGFWHTLPGIFTGLATIITALTGFVVALQQAGVLGVADRTQSQSKSEDITTADLIVGKWSGKAKDANGTSFEIGLNVEKSCTVNAKCGSISVSHVPCYGELFLYQIEQDGYEFRVDNFTSNSSPTCTPGAGEHFTLLSDGTLLYTTTYEPKAKGILKIRD
jgi:hypothetical protein